MQQRILIIEDDPTVHKPLKEILEGVGYIVDTAETGKEAIEKTNKNLYNLALVDIRLPDMEGTKLLTMMKQTTPKMMKIILTGYPSMENAIEAVNRGADDYIIKPVLDMKELVNTIKEKLKQQQEEQRYSEEKVKEFTETKTRELED